MNRSYDSQINDDLMVAVILTLRFRQSKNYDNAVKCIIKRLFLFNANSLTFNLRTSIVKLFIYKKIYNYYMYNK